MLEGRLTLEVGENFESPSGTRPKLILIFVFEYFSEFAKFLEVAHKKLPCYATGCFDFSRSKTACLSPSS